MQIKEKAKLLSAVSKPYSINGNEGISYKVRVLVSDSIWELKSSKENVERFTQFVGKVGDATFEVVSYKEAVSLQLVNFDVK